MGNILYEHNQKAYKAAVSMLQETGRAAIIHPTGTGKSFIAFQFCADHAECKICWLSPSEYIFTTQMEKWRAAGGGELNNIEFITYARLMRMDEDALAKIQPDGIVLDEFHRLGAAQWGGGVKRLREMYPGAKTLGLSATNIRYLDNGRDMAWELFGGNIASELTLGAAIVQGILPAPKYVLSVYSYQKELKRYELRVRQARNKAVRDETERELEALRRALEKADGLPEIFARHMASGNRVEATPTEKTAPGFPRRHMAYRNCAKATAGQKDYGRYIVFCANYGHLLQMRELAPEWFAKVDPAPHIYTAYSDDPETSSEFAAFKADQSPHLKLLYCIDMLNEGIHVDGLSGVILLRPTVSPTIYKQQIGRALAAGGKETPAIFDIVMNIENLLSIGAVEQELKEAVFAFRANGMGDKVMIDHFRVVDEVSDCRRLFARLNETLSASWDAMYAMAKEYYKANGNLEIPVSYATTDGYSLGAWVVTQRKIYTGKTAGCLNTEQIHKLEKIGMRWQGAQESAWERNFAEAEKYFRQHGNLAIPADFVTENGCKLGRWLRRQKELYQKLLHTEELSDDKKISDSPLHQDQNQPQGITETFLSGQNNKEHVNISKPEQKTEPERKNFSTAKRESIHMKHIRRLTEIGMTWEKEDPWEYRFNLAKQYYEEHGDLRMPADYVVEGIWLERWLRAQKARILEETKQMSNVPETAGNQGNHVGLTVEQKRKLFSLGIRPGITQAELSWREQYQAAAEFYQMHGNLSIPKRYTAPNGKNLGAWLSHQRAGHRSGALAGWQVHLLDGLGMVWEAGDSWGQGFAHAEGYFRANGHLAVPNDYICTDGYRLGKWISNQRCAYGKAEGNGLSGERVRQLESIGMVWSAKRGRRAGKKDAPVATGVAEK